MDVVVDTKFGRITVRFGASAWRNRASLSVVVDAPFLPVALSVGKKGIPKLANVLNGILSGRDDAKEMIEFLRFASLGNATHCLSALERHGLEATLARMRKKNRGIERYIKIALDLKNSGYSIFSGNLIVLGENHTYVAKNCFKKFYLWNPTTVPKVIQRIWTAKETRGVLLDLWPEGCVLRQRWLETLASDRTAVKNLCSALERTKRAWLRKREADLLARLFRTGET
jgi:hypothetical protein